jgi:hypothetical protein
MSYPASLNALRHIAMVALRAARSDSICNSVMQVPIGFVAENGFAPEDIAAPDQGPPAPNTA